MSFSTGCRKCQKCGKMYLINLFDGGLCAECEKVEQEPKITTTSTDEPMVIQYPKIDDTMVMQYPQVDGITPTVVKKKPTLDNLWENIKKRKEEVEQEPCDAISRQAVEDAIYDYSRSCDVNYAQIMEYIDKLPSVRPQEQTGHWDCKEIANTTITGYWCSKCHIGSSKPYDYCPICGARMVEQQESEE